MLAGSGQRSPTPLSQYAPAPTMGERQPTARAKLGALALGQLARDLAAGTERQESYQHYYGHVASDERIEDLFLTPVLPPEGRLRFVEQPLAERRTSYVPGRVTGPVQFLARLLDLWRLDFLDACSLLGFEHADSESVKRLFSGVASLRGRDSKDRIAILIRIRTLLAGLFQDINVENAWLREQHPDLNGRTPLHLLREGSMENLLTLRNLVERAAGL